jgi:hypothetical protein
MSLPLGALAMMAMLAGCGDTASPTALRSRLDTTPPPAPANLILSQDGMGRPLLTLEASAAPDVIDYQVYVYSPERDNAYVIVDDPDTGDCAFLLPTVGGTTHAVYRVRAVDAAGNTSAFSAAATIVMGAPGGGRPDADRNRMMRGSRGFVPRVCFREGAPGVSGRGRNH